MISLKNILVATDFSEPSRVALDYGRDLARAYGSALHVLHVIEGMPPLYGAEVAFSIADFERNIEAAAYDELDAEIERLGVDRQTTQVIVKRGPGIARVITEFASANEIDLIVVGTHGRGAVSRFLMGSVAERVVRSAPCPVLTVRAREDVSDAAKDQVGESVNTEEAPKFAPGRA